MRLKNPMKIQKMISETVPARGSLNECYFANKGAALVLGGSEWGCADQRRSPARAHPQPDIQHHLQSMFYLLRPEETLKMAVKLESAHAGRTRYLVVVCRHEEAALLGIDCNERTTVGLVLRVLADTSIKLDGDGGFSVCVCNQQHIFKPVSVQAMWSALQTLHRASSRARACNHFAGGTSHAWCAYYESHVDSDRSCLNEWHAMDCIESRRPPSPDSLRLKPREREETERVIRCTLKEIMMSVDIDEVTSKVIRGRLEEELDMDLAEYKSFIDQEMLTILGQMDAPTEIFDHVYLGSEWNASNLEELQRNGVRHILNVTREIDNFFPGMFDYLNIRVYDDEKTDLLKHWDNTYKYINKARNAGSKVLVHCKMGISRSASVVIAYAMKAFNWNFDKALKHVKAKRNCIKPNTNFLNQLETYQGILDAMKNKEKLQRSKSETNLKSPKTALKVESKATDPLPFVLAQSAPARPRSWSPDSRLACALLPPTSVSLENLASETRHILMPYANGSYSVSPNQIIRLKEEGAPSVKHIVNEIENATGERKDCSRRYQRLNFGNQNEPGNPKSFEALTTTLPPVDTNKVQQASPSRNTSHKYPNPNVEDEKIHTWDPGEAPWRGEDTGRNTSDSDNIVKSDSGIIDVKTKTSDAYSNLVDRNIECEDRRTADEDAPPPSRQSSWSSFDSAVVPDLSRHSSWGSYDTRGRPAPRDDPLARIREHPHHSCAILQALGGAARASTWSGRLSASAPADTWLRAGLRRRRPACASHGDLPRRSAPPAPGLVSNLKKEFEARSGGAATGAPPRERAASPPEDVSVRVLVGRYSASEAPRKDSLSKKSRLAEASAALRHSYCGARSAERPPPAPTVVSLAPIDYSDVVVSTVMSKAQNKKQLQHGKTHPLTRLNMNRSNNRCSNPVYNTM
ncbi:uncharacterized protein LOC106139045 isoform X2 [Amyelois transitella]|uniref:uncharacterized protein LOC106139045 isoform X2 n=1 Tax=Amyelois transitella TaxID=680683 RepID=UPI00299073DA|nr:uncharacterized protein LOC106139045 isoform X2 [Amyelois transitella]XP_060800478.1 uncharacterized protein LOC106139045 isoform X2 [Amyelois transitella]XP_060800479.1 uncharacterized protein LOC106139045 isoform X2 [Amyelois transitella]